MQRAWGKIMGGNVTVKDFRPAPALWRTCRRAVHLLVLLAAAGRVYYYTITVGAPPASVASTDDTNKDLLQSL